MKILGITGRSGSGKGYVCALFSEQGIPIIDTDKIVHRLYRENGDCIADLAEQFGPILTETGEIDRKKLAQIVFSDDSKLAKLNMIVHRYVKNEIKRIFASLDEQGKDAVLIDAPQLFEAGLEKVCDFVIVVSAPEALRVERICKRDSIDELSARNRLAHQYDDSYLLERADAVIINDGITDVKAQVQQFLNRITLK